MIFIGSSWLNSEYILFKREKRKKHGERERERERLEREREIFFRRTVGEMPIVGLCVGSWQRLRR